MSLAGSARVTPEVPRGAEEAARDERRTLISFTVTDVVRYAAVATVPTAAAASIAASAVALAAMTTPLLAYEGMTS